MRNAVYTGFLTDPTGEPLEPVIPEGCVEHLVPAGVWEEGDSAWWAAGRWFYPLIAINHVLNDAVMALPGVRPTGQAGEALVPVAISPDRLTEHLGETPVVYGPGAALEALGESLRLTRQGADLLATGQATADTQGDSPLVPLRDLTGHLLVAGTPLLTQMAIERHLDTLATLEPGFRLELAAILLDWLTTGDPVKDLATRHNISMNTGYSRLRRARQLIGEQALTDPPRRFEITIALHHTVPLWRHQAGQ